MEKAKIKTGDFEVFVSGEFISLQSGSIEVPDANGLVIEFEFLEDTSREKSEIEATGEGEKTIKVKFYNFNSALGTGNIEPIEVGAIDDKPLLFSYRIYKLDNTKLRTFEYTFYKGK